MSRFIKFLILVAAVINLAFVFVFDGKLPSDLPLPFIKDAAENEAAEPETAEPMPAAEAVAEAEEEIRTEEAEEEAEAEEPAADESEEVLPRCRISAAGGSNIRSGPGTNFDVVTAYPYDTVLVLTGEAEIGWYPIMAEDGTEGYIFENQIEILEENTAEEDIPQAEDLMQ